MIENFTSEGTELSFYTSDNSNSGLAPIRGIAYTGGIGVKTLNDGSRLNIVVDLSSLTESALKLAIPVKLEHVYRFDYVLGRANLVSDIDNGSNVLKFSGFIYKDYSYESNAISRLVELKHPLRVSIGASDGTFVPVKRGEVVELNGRKFDNIDGYYTDVTSINHLAITDLPADFYAAIEYNSLSKEKEKMSFDNNVNLSQEVISLRNEKVEFSAKVTKLELEKIEFSTKITSLENKVSALEVEKNNLDNEIASLQSKLSDIDFNKEIAEFTAKNAGITFTADELKELKVASPVMRGMLLKSLSLSSVRDAATKTADFSNAQNQYNDNQSANYWDTVRQDKGVV